MAWNYLLRWSDVFVRSKMVSSPAFNEKADGGWSVQNAWFGARRVGLISGCIMEGRACIMVHNQNLAYRHGLIMEILLVYRYCMYWNRLVLTDRHTAHNKLHVISLDRMNRSAYIIDFAIPHTTLSGNAWRTRWPMSRFFEVCPKILHAIFI